MICKVIDTIERYRLFDGVKSVAVGVSGGADSMCLIHILSLLKEKYGIIIEAVHINHNLRGEESLRDEELVREYCREKTIHLTVHSVDISSLSEKLGIGTEECGRKVRYECFEKAGCDAVAVAHTLSDSIETTVYNLLRGTGTKGLCGIPVKREPNIIRPLISCTREEVEAFCEKECIPYVNDSTNFTDDYTRNYIRHNIIPAFYEVNASCAKSISRACDILKEENDYIESSAAALIKAASEKDGYDVQIFKAAHPAVRKRAILLLLSDRMKKQPLFRHAELIDSVIETGCGKVEIATDLYVKAANGKFCFIGRESEIGVWQVCFEDGIASGPYGVYYISEIDNDEGIRDVFDAEKIKGVLTLSSRREGDRFTFGKRKVSKSLKKLFNEMKVPVGEREKLAVLRDGENIIWVEGVGVNSPYIPEENSKTKFLIKKDG